MKILNIGYLDIAFHVRLDKRRLVVDRAFHRDHRHAHLQCGLLGGIEIKVVDGKEDGERLPSEALVAGQEHVASGDAVEEDRRSRAVIAYAGSRLNFTRTAS